MYLCTIETPPENLDEFVAEILPEYSQLHGPVASQNYEMQSALQLQAAIMNPAIRAYAALIDRRAIALFLVRSGPQRHVLSFAHVLGAEQHTDVGPRLLEFILADDRLSRDRIFVTECMFYAAMGLGPTFEHHGFSALDRSFMRTSAFPTRCRPCPADYAVHAARPEDHLAMAHALHRAYVLHPERALYNEVTTVQSAREFIEACESGFYGHLGSGYALAAWHEDTCVGMAIGTEVVAEMGFVIHMAVVPEHQQRGLGHHFLDLLMANFENDGLEFAALCVTRGNNATHLYRDAGFETLRDFPVYIRKPAHS